MELKMNDLKLLFLYLLIIHMNMLWIFEQNLPVAMIESLLMVNESGVLI